MNKIEFFFFKNYLFSEKKEWLRFDSLFSIIGVILSVATLTIAHSIFGGYETALKDSILGANSHIYIFQPGAANLNQEQVNDLIQDFGGKKEVEAIAPVIQIPAMAVNEGRIKGALIKGINWKAEAQPTKYRQYIRQGTWEMPDNKDVVMGKKLADELNLTIGDLVKIVSPLHSKFTPLGYKSKSKKFKIVGLYESGMYEYDSKFVFMNMQSARGFSPVSSEYSLIEIKLKSEFINKADYLAYKWEMLNDGFYQISSWIEFNGNLFMTLSFQKWILFIIISFLILLASFNIVSAVSTSIIEKKKEIGILKAFGASSFLLSKIFVGKTMILSSIGVLLGQLIGYIIAYFLSVQNFFLLKGDVYFLEKINVKFSFQDFTIIFIISILMIFVASLVPLKRVSSLQITDILRGM